MLAGPMSALWPTTCMPPDRALALARQNYSAATDMPSLHGGPSPFARVAPGSLGSMRRQCPRPVSAMRQVIYGLQEACLLRGTRACPLLALCQLLHNRLRIGGGRGRPAPGLVFDLRCSATTHARRGGLLRVPAPMASPGLQRRPICGDLGRCTAQSWMTPSPRWACPANGMMFCAMTEAPRTILLCQPLVVFVAELIGAHKGGVWTMHKGCLPAWIALE